MVTRQVQIQAKKPVRRMRLSSRGSVARQNISMAAIETTDAPAQLQRGGKDSNGWKFQVRLVIKAYWCPQDPDTRPDFHQFTKTAKYLHFNQKSSATHKNVCMDKALISC